MAVIVVFEARLEGLARWAKAILLFCSHLLKSMKTSKDGL